MGIESQLSAREILMRLNRVLSGAPLLLDDAWRGSIVRAWYDIEVGEEGRTHSCFAFTAISYLTLLNRPVVRGTE